MRSFSATVKTNIAAQRTLVFDYIVPIDLASIFTGYGLLPAVSGTQNQTGAWDAVGQTRTVILSDGSTATELLTSYEHPHYFSYTVSGFTGILRLFTNSANGEWWFDRNASLDRTRVKWRYTFNSRSIFSIPAVWFITKFMWRGYMAKALRISKAQIEGGVAQQQNAVESQCRAPAAE